MNKTTRKQHIPENPPSIIHVLCSTLCWSDAAISETMKNKFWNKLDKKTQYFSFEIINHFPRKTSFASSEMRLLSDETNVGARKSHVTKRKTITPRKKLMTSQYEGRADLLKIGTWFYSGSCAGILISGWGICAPWVFLQDFCASISEDSVDNLHRLYR